MEGDAAAGETTPSLPPAPPPLPPRTAPEQPWGTPKAKRIVQVGALLGPHGGCRPPRSDRGGALGTGRRSAENREGRLGGGVGYGVGALPPPPLGHLSSLSPLPIGYQYLPSPRAQECRP